MNRTQRSRTNQLKTDTLILEKQIKNPQKLKMLILSGSTLMKEQFLFIMKCKNLIKLDISSSNLSRFPKEFSFSNLTNLQFLHLHNNKFKNIQELKPIFETTSLIYLTLQNNPFQTNSKIQHFIINIMKHLKAINDRIIFQQQRMPNIITTKPHVKINLEFYYTKTEELDQKYYIKILELQLFYIEKIWIKNNPIIKLQRKWRKYLRQKKNANLMPRKQKKQKRIIQKGEQNNFISSFFQFWKEFYYSKNKLKKFLKTQEKNCLLLQPISKYKTHLRNQKVRSIVSNFVKKIREKVTIRKAIRTFAHRLMHKVMVFNSQTSFYNVTQLYTHNRIIFAKNQKHLLINFLQHCKMYMNQRKIKIPKYEIKNSNSYVTVRYVQPQRLQKKIGQSLYNIFLSPSMRCIFLYKKKEKILKKKAFSNIIKIKQLPHIQRLNMHLTKKEYDKSNQIYEKLTKYMTNEYFDSSYQFVCENAYFFKVLLRFIYYHNSKTLQFQKIQKKQTHLEFLDNYKQNFVFYIDKELKRSVSAVIIQKFWKKYWTIKNSKQNLYQSINKGRSAQRIQKFYRQLNFRHRLHFDKLLNDYLKQIQTNTLCLQSQIYMNLINFKSTKELYRRIRLWINNSTNNIFLSWQHTKKVFTPNIYKYFKDQPVKKSDYISLGDLYHILHLNSEITIIKMQKGYKFYEFKFNSIQQARKRAAYLAVLTYKYQFNGCFVKLLKKQQLNHKFLQQYQQKLNQIHKIKLNHDQIIQNNYKSKVVYNPQKFFIFTDRITIRYQKRILTKPKKFQVQFFEHERLDGKPIKLIDVFLTKIVMQNEDELQSQKTQKHSPQKNNFINNQQKKKRLSIYDIEWRQSYQNSSKKKTITPKQQNTIQNIYNPTNIIKNLDLKTGEMKSLTSRQTQRFKYVQNISQNNINKNITMEQKHKIQLNKARKLYTQQKSRNLNLKFIRENQQLLINKMKVEKIQQAKRYRKLIKQQEIENDFIQKGNFLIKQQFRLSLIKNRIAENQKKKLVVSRKPPSRQSSFQKKKQYSRASMSEQRSIVNQQQISIPFSKDQKSKPQQPEIINNNKKNQIQLIIEFDSSSKDFKQFQAIKKKKDKLVHGVFPQQFYAISKKSMAIQLPKI